MSARTAEAQRLGRYVELELEESTANRCSNTLSEYLPIITTTHTEQDIHAQARGPGKHIDYAEEGMTNRQLNQPTLRPTETRSRGVRAASLSSDNDAMSGVEPPLEEGSQDDGMNPRRRVDDGADNGRSSSPDIGGREDGTGHNTVHYTAEYPHKQRRLRGRDVAAPDAVYAGKMGAAARLASSCCSTDGERS